jgi:hypothetical protein
LEKQSPMAHEQSHSAPSVVNPELDENGDLAV